jgi:hypothetical protein
MEGVARKLSPAAFVLALICFFLPFVTFSCQGQKIASLNGVQLATGTTLQQPQMFGPPKSQKVDAEPLAALALLALLAGAGLSLLKGKKGAGMSAAFAGLSFIFLLALKSKLDGDAVRQGGGAIQVNYEAGFYLVIVLLLAAIGAGIYTLAAGKGIPAPAGPAPPAPTIPADAKFCPKCGAPSAADDAFCKKCGANLN